MINSILVHGRHEDHEVHKEKLRDLWVLRG